jgi:hypothetical protein
LTNGDVVLAEDHIVSKPSPKVVYGYIRVVAGGEALLAIRTTEASAMSGRPEGNDGGYDSFEEPDSRAWEEFTPWQPGDKPASGQPVPAQERRESQGFKWTEEQPESFDVGDRVRSAHAVGGMFGTAVPMGTIGHVVSTSGGLFDEYVTVQFESGYTEELAPSDIEHKGFFD